MKTVGQVIEELKKFDPRLPMLVEDGEYNLNDPAPRLMFKDPREQGSMLYDSPVVRFYNVTNTGPSHYDVTMHPVVIT